MPTTTGTIARRTPLIGVNNPNVQTSLTAGNDSLVVASAAADGLVFVRDRTQTDGWGIRALTNADVGLANVENTALSTWAGSANLTTTGALTGGSTGAGFTVALSTSTITGTLADGRLSANVPLINAANVFSASQRIEKDALAVTSTDGLTVQNTTAATAGVPVQQSPRLRFRSQVWNTTATAATNTDDWWIETVPVSGTVPAGALVFNSSLNGAAATQPVTLSSTGLIVTGPGGWGGLPLSPSCPLIVQSLAAGLEMVQTGFASTDVHYRWQIHNSASSSLFEFNYFTGSGVSVQTGWTMNPTNAVFTSNGAVVSPSIQATTTLSVGASGNTWTASTGNLVVAGSSTLTGAIAGGSTLTASGDVGFGGAITSPGLLKGGWDQRSNGALMHMWGVGRGYFIMTAVTDLAAIIMEVTTSGTSGRRAFQQYFGFDAYTMTFVSESTGAVVSTPLTLGHAGGITVQAGFGCNGKTSQTAFASGGVLAAYASGTAGFDTGAHASALYAQVVAIQAALVANGIMS